MNTSQAQQELEQEPRQRPRLQPPTAPHAGRTVAARTLLSREECAHVEKIEAETGRPAFVQFRLLDASFESRLDGLVPAGAVAQRNKDGPITGQVIVGG